jgi:hypothetical protein
MDYLLVHINEFSFAASIDLGLGEVLSLEQRGFVTGRRQRIPRVRPRAPPPSTYLAKWKAPISPVTRAGGMVFVSGLPPFDPATGRRSQGLRQHR